MNLRILLTAACLWSTLSTSAAALTVEEILLLKQNGVSEETIQMMLQSEMQAGRLAAAEQDRMGVRTIVRPNGQPAIVYSTGSDGYDDRLAEERLREERAWEMLRHIIVDTREVKDGRWKPDEGRRGPDD